MARHLLDNESFFGTPAASKSYIFSDSTSKKLMQTDDAGIVHGILSKNYNATQGPGFASDTYLTGSNLVVPTCAMQVGMLFRWFFSGSKTAASTATPALTFRFGVGLSISDPSLLALTFAAAQTAALDAGGFVVTLLVTTSGASGAVYGQMNITRNVYGATGFGVNQASGTASALNLTGAGSVGISINGGASSAWTLTGLYSELVA